MLFIGFSDIFNDIKKWNVHVILFSTLIRNRTKNAVDTICPSRTYLFFQYTNGHVCPFITKWSNSFSFLKNWTVCRSPEGQLLFHEGCLYKRVSVKSMIPFLKLSLTSGHQQMFLKYYYTIFIFNNLCSSNFLRLDYRLSRRNEESLWFHSRTHLSQVLSSKSISTNITFVRDVCDRGTI